MTDWPSAKGMSTPWITSTLVGMDRPGDEGAREPIQLARFEVVLLLALDVANLAAVCDRHIWVPGER